MAKDDGRQNDVSLREKTGFKEIVWFVGLWLAGVAAVAIMGGAIKLAIG